MTLYGIFMATQYYQVFHVYDENDWGQYIYKGFGRRSDLLDEDENPELIDVLCNKVLHILPCKDGSLLIVVKANQYKKRAEKLYDKDYVETWDMRDPKTRPWRFMSEMEKECDTLWS